jgi:hypothetical protein
MINILTNKLSESKDNNIVWKNNNPVLYQKYCQYIQKEENVQKKCNIVPKVLNVIPVSVDRTNKIELVNTTIPTGRVHDIIPVDIVNSNIPVDNSDDSILEDRNHIVPVELDIANIPVDKMRAVVEDRVNTKKNPIKSNNKVKKNVNSPMKIILEESLTYDTFRDIVREKIINLVSSKEFNKVFGITKSAEIMSGIANDRFNKSTVLFISFLFDKCVIYNNKNVIYEKNNGTITIS